LAQALPGPASSQVGIAIGLLRAGAAGGLAAWLGFTLPSAVLMVAAAAGLAAIVDDPLGAGLVAGLGVAAVAVVASAVVAMGRALTPDAPRLLIAVAAVISALALASPLGQVAIIAAAGLAGWVLYREAGPVGRAASEPPAGPVDEAADRRLREAVPGRVGVAALGLFVVGLVGLPLLAAATMVHAIDLVAAMYGAGALVFGGGHVVLPLLEPSVVGSGWVSPEAFVAGYGAAQAIPGPLFSFAAYLGAVQGPIPNGLAGAAIALVAIFVPGALVLIGALPVWAAARSFRPGRAALLGVGAGVVGLLAAALWDPVITTAIHDAGDAALAGIGLGLLLTGRVPPIVVVALCAGAGLARAAV
jgi:chromate transporter